MKATAPTTTTIVRGGSDSSSSSIIIAAVATTSIIGHSPNYNDNNYRTRTSCFLPSSSYASTCTKLLPPSRFPGKELRRWKELYRWRSLSSLVIQARTRRPNNHHTTTSCALSWDDDDKPYYYYDALEEQDVVTFLDPPKQLLPIDPSSYNPSSYLWKKIGDIPQERRHRLLSLLKKPSLISRAWEIAGTKYEDPKLAKKSSCSLLSDGDDAKSIEFWNCQTSAGPAPVSWVNYFKKAVFRCKDGRTYGRFIGGSVLERVSNSFPMYFMVKQLNEVMATEQPCDLAYEFGDGLWDLYDYPQGFPKPAKHPWPFNDQVVVYIRHIGPGVLIGQAWQEGEALQQVPKKLCGEILMVKDYAAMGENQ